MSGPRRGEPDGPQPSAETAVVLLIEIDHARWALPLDDVDEVVAAARIEPLPGGPRTAMGVVNLRGAPVVVVDGAACTGGDPRGLRSTDRFVVLAGIEPRCALRVQAVLDLLPLPTGGLVPTRSLGGAAGDIAILDDGLLVIGDAAGFVTGDDAAQIRDALDALDDRELV